MKRVGMTLSLLVLASSLAGSAIAASAPTTVEIPKGVKPGVIGAIALDESGNLCHLRFPAIRPSTFDSAKPELKSETTGDIIDYYGVCNHDPLGKEELESQKQARTQRRTGK
jgi:hypothetical protein